MPDPLIIQVKGDSSPWEQAIARVKAAARSGADAQEKAAQKAAREIQRQAKIAADGAARERQREIRDATRAFDQVAKAAVKASAIERREAEKAANAAEKEAARATARIEREAQKRAQAQIAEQKRWERANVVSLGSLQSAGIKYQDRVAREAEKSAQAQAKAAAKAAKAQKEGFDLSRAAAGQFMGVIHNIAGEFALFNVGKMAIDAIADAFRKAREQAYDSARFVQDYRESLLEIAALRDRLGGTTKETAEQLAFRAQTLQTQEGAKAYQESLYGAGEAAVKAGAVKPEEFARLGVLGGQFQAVEGGDAASHGRLVGMLPLITGGKLQTADELFGKEQQIYQVLKPGNFQKFSQGVDQLLTVSGYAQNGAYKDISQEAAVLSAFSTINPDAAGTLTEQFTRATIGSQGRMKGPKIVGADVEKVGPYLKRLGVTDQMDAIQIGDLIASDMAKAEQAEVSQGRTFNAIDYLGKHGYGNQEERDALNNYYAMKKSGLFDNTFMAAAMKPGDATGVQADIARWQHADPLAKGRRSQISEAAAKAAIGMGGMEDYMNLQRQAFDVMVKNGTASGNFEDWAKDYTWGGNTKINNQLLSAMAKEAKAHGLDYGYKGARVDPRTGEEVAGSGYWDFGKTRFSPADFYMMDDRHRASMLADVNTEIGSKGGNVSAELLRELIAATNKTNELVQKQIDMANKGAPVKPPIAGARPAPAMNR